jgi:2-(1,2-epoxy-1,2-dihydrophenyl)acetyl-CoA isomerase
MKSDAPVIVERDGLVAHLRFNRPLVLNAISQDLADALAEGCARVASEGWARAVLLSGEGRGFMAGGDISAFHAAGENAPAVVEAIIAKVHQAVRTLNALPVPVLAAVHGPVAGAGLSMMMAADIVLAAEGTRFVLAYPRIGASPDGGATWALPRALGLRRSLGFALLGEEMDTTDALAAGLINKVYPAVLLMEQARDLAHKLATGPTLAFGRTKALLRQSLDTDLATQLEAERAAFVTGAGTADFREGVAAFLEKRPARFNGR